MKNNYKITPTKLAVFCALMDHHGDGFEHAHPDYMLEKYEEILARSDEQSIALLDEPNRYRFGLWQRTWTKK